MSETPTLSSVDDMNILLKCLSTPSGKEKKHGQYFKGSDLGGDGTHQHLLCSSLKPSLDMND